ncbi:YjbE family putative metal transport protein, partial [Parageobacillus sp. SY1]
MELFSMEFLSALLSIIIIDLVLAGDNAIVIGLAARNLPKHQQKKAVIWGTVGAVVIRALSTLFVVWLLKVPGLLLIGGILLVWIAYKLLVEEKGHDVEAVGSLWEAIRTIIIADALMGLDNVLAVAGAAHGSFLLVILGLLISVPIMV